MKHALFLFSILLPLALRAGVRLELSPQEITLDDSASLSLHIDGPFGGGSIDLPLPDGLVARGQSRQTTIVNGQQSTTLTIELQALRSGSYSLGPYQINFQGQTHTLPAVSLNVTPAKVFEQKADELFVTLESSSTTALVQQPIELRLSFFSLHSIEDLQLLEFPADGFEVGEWQEIGGREQVVNGKRYRVRRFVNRLTPLSPGKLSLSPIFMVQVAEPGAMQQTLFGLRRSTDLRNLRVRPKALEIEITSPPLAGRPADFSGHIGRFHLSATASPAAVKVGDPVTLRIQLSGNGAIRQALPPSFSENDDFNVYAPRLIEEDIQRDGTSGRKVFEQVLIPKHANITEIPALRFSFYNPELNAYETREAGPFPLKVEGVGGAPARAAMVSSLAPAGSGSARMLGEDLVYLKTRPQSLSRPLRGLPPSTAAAAIPLAVWALFALFCARRERLNADPAARRRRQAPQLLRKQLAALSATEDEAALHAAFWNCLSGHLQNRLNLPPGDIDAQRLPPHLPASLSDATRAELLAWISRCERARFAGNSAAQDADRLIADFRNFMLKLDGELAA